jgi:hypothetical protein
MPEKKKHYLKIAAIFVVSALLVSGLCLLGWWLFDIRVKEISCENLITELSENEQKSLFDTVLLDDECAKLVAAYIPIDEGKEYSIKEYAVEVTDKIKFSEYLSRFTLEEEAEKSNDISFGDSVLSCKNVYSDSNGYIALYEYGQNYWLIKQGNYISDTHRQIAEEISYKYAFKKLYG